MTILLVKMIKKSFVLYFFLLISGASFGQKEIYQGLFLYQFSKYVKWPDSYNTGSFTIGIVGNEDAFNSINGMAKTKKETQGMPIVVESYTSTSQIQSPHIIFIDQENSDKLNMVINQVKNKPVLIVTEKPGLAEKGSTINFVETEGKMRFELNLEKAKSSGLMISSSLTSLAILI